LLDASKGHSASGMKGQEANCTVKNTFLEFSAPEETEYSRGTRRTRSDVIDRKAQHSSPLVVASKSPSASPSLHPVDECMQAVPIDEVSFELLEEAAVGCADFELREEGVGSVAQSALVAQRSPGLGGDEPAYIVPTTPSPFLHSAFPPSVVPPFGYGAGMGGYMGPGMLDLGLPPAYGAEGEGGPQLDGEGNFIPGMPMQDADGNQYMQGMPFMPEMYDPSMTPYMPYGWPGMQQMDPSMMQQGFPQQGGEQCVPGSWEQAGDEAGAADKKEGRRGKGRKKDREGFEEKASAGAASLAQKTEKAAAPQVKAGDLSAAGEANQAAFNAEEEYTTVMLRNIPNKYTREMLVKQLCVDFNGLFDFMYLPIDFKNKCNVGYGFINFRTQDATEYFVQSFHGVDVRKCLPGLNSKKIVEVTPARVQGLQQNVQRLRNSPVMNQLADHPEWMPLLFNDDGIEEPFPSPDQPLPPVKPRGRARVEVGPP